jgi:hypothetical protein
VAVALAERTSRGTLRHPNYRTTTDDKDPRRGSRAEVGAASPIARNSASSPVEPQATAALATALNRTFVDLQAIGARPNTVQLVARTVMVGGPSGWGQWRWRARLTCHLGILRLMRRGLERWRRMGLRRAQSSAMA